MRPFKLSEARNIILARTGVWGGMVLVVPIPYKMPWCKSEGAALSGPCTSPDCLVSGAQQDVSSHWLPQPGTLVHGTACIQVAGSPGWGCSVLV